MTRQVLLRLERLGEGPDPVQTQAYRTGFLGQLRIKRSEFEMNNFPQLVGDDVALTMSCEGVRQ